MNDNIRFIVLLMLCSSAWSYAMENAEQRAIGTLVNEADILRLRECVSSDELDVGDIVVVKGKKTKNNKGHQYLFYGKISGIKQQIYFIDMYTSADGRSGRYCTIGELFIIDESRSGQVYWDDGSDSEDEQDNFAGWESPFASDDEDHVEPHASIKNRRSLSTLLLTNLQHLVQENTQICEESQQEKFNRIRKYWQDIQNKQ